MEHNWPASREKGPSDITNSVDPDQPTYNVENTYVIKMFTQQDK